MRLVRPGTAAVAGAEREQRAGVVREEEPPVADRGRELEQARPAREPQPAEWRAEVDPVRKARARGVEPVHRPRNRAQLDRGPLAGRSLSGDELDRRGAVDV